MISPNSKGQDILPIASSGHNFPVGARATQYYVIDTRNQKYRVMALRGQTAEEALRGVLALDTSMKKYR